MRRRKRTHGNVGASQNRKIVMITGATGGIGMALAKEFIRCGYRLILVASREERLRRLTARLERACPTCVVAVIRQDLSISGAAAKLYGKLREKNIQVDILVNNAGIGLVGEEIHLPLIKERKMIGLNISAVTELTHLFLRDMCQRGEGKILNVASVGAFQPGPYTAAYYATKSYVASFSRALRVEAREHGVQISVLCPGTTRTEFFERAGSSVPMWAMSADRVARAAVRGLEKNKEIIVPGIGNRVLQLLPERIKLRGIAWLKR